MCWLVWLWEERCAMSPYTHVCVCDGCRCVCLWEFLRVCACVGVCVMLLTNKPREKSRLICTSLHRISINLPAISTPGTLITLLLRSPNNSVQTSENKNKHCTQVSQEVQCSHFAGLPAPLLPKFPLFLLPLLVRTPSHQIKVFPAEETASLSKGVSWSSPNSQCQLLSASLAPAFTSAVRAASD